MRKLVVLSALALASCGDDRDRDPLRVTFRLDGAISGVRSIVVDRTTATESVESGSATLMVGDGAFGGPRIACTQVGDTFVLSAVQNYGEAHGAGVYLKVKRFAGAGGYTLDDGGRAWLFDRGHIQACTRDGDRTCYQAGDGCTLQVERWDVTPAGAPYPSGVLAGEARGRFACGPLVNATTGGSVRILDGRFVCRAEDWTVAGR
ncbi:MAG: hypothetical protein HYV09_13645 [Deltaproteobacteria bacterium]|nr:hypothetical protein [Deltaproteobacteria bacterium]